MTATTRARANPQGFRHASGLFALALVSNLLLLAWAALLVQVAARPTQVVLALLLACIPNALLWQQVPRWDWFVGLRWPAVLVACLPGALFLGCSESPLSDDLYRFIWDARVWLETGNPYRFAPAAPELSHLRDPVYGRINYPQIATIYPPVAQGLFALSHALGDGLLAIKCVAFLAHLATVCVLATPLSTDLDGPRAGARRLARACAYACNPLALAETALSGHMDSYVGLALLVAAICLRGGKRCGLLLSLVACTGIKLFGLLFVPWLWRGRRPLAILLLLSGAFLTWPLFGAGGSNGSAGLLNYAQRWQGNEGGFAVVEAISAPLVRVAGESGRGGLGADEVYLAALEPLLRALYLQGIDVRYRGGERQVPRPLAVFPATYVTGLVARLLVAVLLLTLSFHLGGGMQNPRGMRLLVLALLLLSPQVHPWYLLWLLPLDIALGGSVMLVWSTVVLASYAPLDGWVALRVWMPAVWVQWVQYGLVGLALLAAHFRRPVRRVDNFRSPT